MKQPYSKQIKPTELGRGVLEVFGQDAIQAQVEHVSYKLVGQHRAVSEKALENPRNAERAGLKDLVVCVSQLLY
jgi:hypothetical protein